MTWIYSEEGRERSLPWPPMTRGRVRYTARPAGRARRWEREAPEGGTARTRVDDLGTLGRTVLYGGLLLLAVTASTVSSILFVVVGTTNAVLFGVLVWAAALVLGAWVLLVRRWPWSANDVMRDVATWGERPRCSARILAPFNSGWLVVTDRYLWLTNRILHMVRRRPPVAFPFVRVRGYKLLSQRGDRGTLLLRVASRESPPARAVPLWKEGEWIMRLPMSRDDIQEVIDALEAKGIRRDDRLEWSGLWGLRPSGQDVMAFVAAWAAVTGMAQFLIHRPPSLESLLLFSPLGALAGAGLLRLLQGDRSGLLLLIGGIGAAAMAAQVVLIDAPVWVLLYLLFMGVTGLAFLRDAEWGVEGWAPRFLRLMWALWFVMGVVLYLVVEFAM